MHRSATWLMFICGLGAGILLVCASHVAGIVMRKQTSSRFYCTNSVKKKKKSSISRSADEKEKQPFGQRNNNWPCLEKYFYLKTVICLFFFFSSIMNNFVNLWICTRGRCVRPPSNKIPCRFHLENLLAAGLVSPLWWQRPASVTLVNRCYTLTIHESFKLFIEFSVKINKAAKRF